MENEGCLVNWEEFGSLDIGRCRYSEILLSFPLFFSVRADFFMWFSSNSYINSHSWRCGVNRALVLVLEKEDIRSDVEKFDRGDGSKVLKKYKRLATLWKMDTLMNACMQVSRILESWWEEAKHSGKVGSVDNIPSLFPNYNPVDKPTWLNFSSWNSWGPEKS